MSRTAEVTFFWGGDDRTFRLRIKELETLQGLCSERGPRRILTDLMTNDWRVQDIRETIRLGLYGGGMKKQQADLLIRDYVDNEPLQDNVLAAIAILQAVIVGPPIKT